MSDLVKEAAMFAHAAHAAIKQKRKYTGEDYIVHPHNVANTVAKTPGATPEMIAAAWLHDVAEDCGIELGMIQYFFGPVVAQLVGECSHIDRTNDPRKLPRFERMAIELARAADISPQAKTIKLADLLDNTESIVQRDPKFAVTYMAEKRRLVMVLVGGDEGLWIRAANQVNQFYAPNYSPQPSSVAPAVPAEPAVEPEPPAELPWNPKDTKPKQNGIYQRRADQWAPVFFSRFTDGVWSWTCNTLADAQAESGATISAFQDSEWRGPVASLPAQ